MTNNALRLEDFTSLPKGLDNVVIPLSKVTGTLAEAIYPLYLQARAEIFNDNHLFQLQLKDGELIGSTLQDVSLVNQIISKYGGRVLLPSDLHDDMSVPDMIKDKHYVDGLGIIMRGPTAELYDERARNIAETLEPREEIDVARLKEEPALVTGLKVVSANSGYGFVFTAPEGKKLDVVYSDKFTSAYHNQRFENFDENGVPTDFGRNGKFSNYVGEAPRVSRFILKKYWNFGADSDWNRFNDSSLRGRVVVTSDEVGSR